MQTHLENELDALKIKIFRMADLAMEAVTKAVDSLQKTDILQAKKIIEDDAVLDNLEKEIDSDCVNILVTRQPAAVHLRLVLSFLKINTDLERAGDLATNICRETIKLNGRPLLKPLVDIPRMAEIAVEMIRESFRAISEKNADTAKKVIVRDSELDNINIQIYRELFSYMFENPHTISEALALIMIARALERIGDHATNIAERAVYYIEGVDIRHGDNTA